ncbi:hypothetical protein WKI13_15440 [Teredinibacter turnerae]|uniref:hypothetical protein n=1 Tax=Teredinibacter turnerae TaxID=2426 RepID=UPI001E2C1FAD|nr:hypothetical protein [Teredinibacter turnerae]
MTFYCDEAEDLLQTALLAALKANLGDITHEANRRWLVGWCASQAIPLCRTHGGAAQETRSCGYLCWPVQS